MSGSITIHSDGGARGNPGPAAASFVVTDEKGKVLHKAARFLGETTNNFAEYQGVILALTWLSDNRNILDGDNINFFLDSELITRQINGVYKVKEETLKNLFLIVKNLQDKISNKIIFQNVPRDKNKLADFLVNQELDSKS